MHNASSRIRVILVGSNPSERSPDNTAFHASTRSRMVIDQWFENIDVELHFINVCDRTRSGNRPLRVSEIRECLPLLKSKIDNHGFQNCPIVALGKTASKALTMLGVDFHEMPHPSGLNRFWNDKEKAQLAVEGLVQYIDGQ